MTKVNPQRVYFEQQDEDRDGCGWNVVDRDIDSAVAVRYSTWSAAVLNACRLAVGIPAD